jgi:PAS domain S-box-containing protein
VPSEADQVLCQTLANVAAIAIANGQMYETSQTNAAELKREIVERKRAEAALRESEQHYRDLFDQANEGLLIMTSDGHLTEVNRAFAEMHGYSLEEMNGIDIQALDVLHERTLKVRDDIVRRVLDGEVVRFEVAHYHKDGHVFPLEVTTSLIHLDGTSYFLAFHQDLTEHRQAEEDHRKLQAQLQQSQKMESLGTLAGGVAHDMNNVLGAILGIASAHIGSLPYGSPLHQALDTITKATERGGRMVKSLLGFARQTPAENKKLDMNAILEEQVALLERTTLAKVCLQLNLEAELRPILGDASALTHAFMNLCVNAVDAMPEHGTLTLHTRNVDNEWIEVVVEDNGMGMPKEILEKAPDPFFTTKGIGKGTGLGLSMVFSTVKAHQGQMAIESEPGRGTRVMLRFPVCQQEPPVAAPAVFDEAVTTHGTMKVLLVDDDDLIQSSVRMILEVLGITAVTAVQSGEEALAKLEAGLEADLVILDMNMPGLGGVGTLPRLRVLRPGVPVLLATGRVDQTALTLASAHSGVTLLSKPFGLRELKKHLENIGLG